MFCVSTAVGLVRARREELHLDDADDDYSTRERVEDALRIVVAPALRLSVADQQSLHSSARIVRYGADEIVEYAGQVPAGVTFIVAGRRRLTATADDGSIVPISTLEGGLVPGVDRADSATEPGERICARRGNRVGDRSRPPAEPRDA